MITRPCCRACGADSPNLRSGRSACPSTTDRPVDTIAGLRRSVTTVQEALLRRGMRIDARVVVKLRSQRALLTSGLIADPDQVGVTTARTVEGRRPTTIQIALSAGMPGTLARAVMAHEYGHALLFDRAALKTPPVLSEGFAEFVAHTYLTRDEATCAARALAAEMLRNPDPVYGAGLRLIRDLVAEHGFAPVWATVSTGGRALPDHLRPTARPGHPSRRKALGAGRVGSAPDVAATPTPNPTMTRRSTP